MLLQQSDLRVCTRTGPARLCPGLKDRLPQGSFFLLAALLALLVEGSGGQGVICARVGVLHVPRALTPGAFAL